MRQPELAETFKKEYIREDLQDTDHTATIGKNTTKDSPAQYEEAMRETPSAYPLVQPMKAALYFDTAEGFGDWRIFISTRADGNLREAKKKDPTLFKIIIKKIKYVICEQ